MIVKASFPESFSCVLAAPSERGKTFLLKNLFLSSIQFDRLYIIVSTGDQYEYLKYADIVFIKEIKGLPPPDQLPKDIKKLMIYDDVRGKEPDFNGHFCRGRHSKCNMIYLKQNIFLADRQIDRMLERIENYLFFLNKEVELPRLYIMISLIQQNIVMIILVIYVKKNGKSLIITSSLINLDKTEVLMES